MQGAPARDRNTPAYRLDWREQGNALMNVSSAHLAIGDQKRGCSSVSWSPFGRVLAVEATFGMSALDERRYPDDAFPVGAAQKRRRDFEGGGPCFP